MQAKRAGGASTALSDEHKNWAVAVAAAHSAEAETWNDESVTVRRVAGGFNNALYRVEADGARYACKLYVDDERQRAAREYGTLRLLGEAGLDLAPEPRWLDESCTVLPYPAVAYRWLDGDPIGPAPTPRQLQALVDGFQHLHSLQPTDFEGDTLPDAWFHWFDFEPYLVELRGFLDAYGPWLAASPPEGGHLRDRLERLVAGCTELMSEPKVDPSRGNVPLRLCHVDPNLANVLWCEDERLRWVDWEFSGWGDPALELADLRWHAALAALGDETHAWLRGQYQPPPADDAFESRLAVWDRLLSTRWPFLVLRWLWSEHNGPDRERLSRPDADVRELRARLVLFIERAERLAEAQSDCRAIR